jgi:hypothetical protein
MTHSLIASINYATDSLGLYRAELARILGLMCSDVGDSLLLEDLLNRDAETNMRAQRFVFFFSRLEILFDHDSIKMAHWFRGKHKTLGTSPLLAMVDENKLEEVISVMFMGSIASGHVSIE